MPFLSGTCSLHSVVTPFHWLRSAIKIIYNLIQLMDLICLARPLQIKARSRLNVFVSIGMIFEFRARYITPDQCSLNYVASLFLTFVGKLSLGISIWHIQSVKVGPHILQHVSITFYMSNKICYVFSTFTYGISSWRNIKCQQLKMLSQNATDQSFQKRNSFLCVIYNNFGFRRSRPDDAWGGFTCAARGEQTGLCFCLEYVMTAVGVPQICHPFNIKLKFTQVNWKVTWNSIRYFDLT